MQLRYRTYRSALRARFARPVRRIPVNAGFSCPNRDGTLSHEGCTFCDNNAFSPVASTSQPPVEQLRAVIARISPRYELFIPYLQPYSNTYGPVDRLQAVYEPLLEVPGVVGLAIGTRPDCLPEEVCEYLAAVAGRTYLCVELGLQAANDDVLVGCNRGHDVGAFREAVGRLAARGIETVAHVMVGLPGQTARGVLGMADMIAALPVSGVKIHQVMIVAGTPLERQYRAGTVSPPSFDAYVRIVGAFIARLRPDQCIHRLAAEAHGERGLIAPHWSVAKGRVIEAVNRFMAREGIVQGARSKAGFPEISPTVSRRARGEGRA